MADFQLPIEKFLVTKIQENFPDFDIRDGTAFRDMLIKPMVVFLQPYRDQVNVLKRNLSLQNFETMIDEEMDALVYNIFISRRGGVKSEGTVRIYVTSTAQVSFSTDVKFQTATGLTFNPKEVISFTAEQLALNVEGLYFYADIPCVAESEGVNYDIDPHTIVYISGGPSGIAKVDNLTSFTNGVNTEDNATLYNRAKNSISTRDLVTKKSISAVMLETFNTLKEVTAIGFGDPEMERDVITTILDLLVTVESRNTGSVTGSGTTFTDIDIVAPIDFIATGIMPGHRLVILSGANAGNHTIKSVTGPQQLELYDTLTIRTDIEYGIDGFAIKDDYHVGGKVDVYVDTTGQREQILYLEPASADNDLTEVASLPVIGIKSLIDVIPGSYDPILPAEDHTLWAEHTAMSADYVAGKITGTGNTFEDPTFNFLTSGMKPSYSVYIIDGVNAGSHMIKSILTPFKLELYETLLPRNDVHYRIEANDFRLDTGDSKTRLSVNENISLKLLTPTSIPDRCFIGSTLACTYYTDPTIAEYQNYVENDLNRVVTADMLVKRCFPIFVDLDVSYRGTATTTEVVNVITEFINNLKLGNTFQASDMISTLYFFNVDYVDNAFTIYAYKYASDGSVTLETSSDSITSTGAQKFIPRVITATNTTV